jgi:Phosphotransferase System HPr (HPr) Family
MQTFMYTIKVPVGLHARHAGLIVKEAKLYQSAITVSCGERSADARHLMALMTLGAKQGELLTVTVEGVDEDVAALKMKALFFAHF